ncbi:MAG TPA: class I poly(R)-hydroxyalkanoic acid synthase [Aliidongia sp.]|uniref:PHA/PHB synthase family protein n=1 Tax=Aliidongia sp. TaxID=1914230 RepID=UPI002DDCD53A|nr:class I poly(R)-hydroxyalkanoic acid synthase [Aliidongia sp.]HEV2674917.1 class I poly(R)-hydroxyalkanoic acid synthase [Aliidongia sp.]
MSNEPSPEGKLPDPVDLSRAVAGIAERSQRLVTEFLAKQSSEKPSVGMGDPLNIAGAFFEMTAKLMVDPTRLVQAQVSLWSDYMQLWQRTTERFLGGNGGAAHPAEPVIETPKGDKRFKDPAWQDHAVFDFIKQSYLLSARFMQTTVRDVEGLDDKTAKKVDFYTRQFVDAMAPSNFVLTNPEVLRATVESRGENLVKGLEHMLDDLERGKGQLAIKMTDTDAFQLGENIATTPGKVVFQNDLMQLIQYAPTTEKVRKRPLLIIPPWINKFYILDLKPKNSFIRWAVAQGHTVFVISWVNPGEELAEKSFEAYMDDGPFAALGAIEAATGEAQVNVIGYCIGGTLLATTLAYMARKGDRRFASATFFTTMVDFAEAGELSVFIDEEQIQALEGRMREKGYLEGGSMANSFNMLRANDLIWSFVINNYLLGKEPFPFDLLFWNSDATRMPCAMHSFYLRNMYQENRLVRPGGVSIHGEPIDLTQIQTPVFILATKEDHIAPWKSSYAATQLYRGPVKFCLAGSGHIAGVVNPPEAQKYNFWTNAKLPKQPDLWFESATQQPGSWWPEWDKWAEKFAGGSVAARQPGDGKLKPVEDAPGSYVKLRIG